MVAAAWTGAADADLAMLLVDATIGRCARTCATIAAATGRVGPALLAGAEQDRPGDAAVAAAADRRAGRAGDVRGDLHGQRRRPATACAALADALAAAVPEGPYLYPEDDLTDLPDRLLAAETVREQIFMQTHEEVPYGATVETETFKERKDGSVRIEATDLCRPARPQGDPDRRQRQQDQGDRRPGAAGPGCAAGAPGASVSQRQGTRRAGTRRAPGCARSAWKTRGRREKTSWSG